MFSKSLQGTQKVRITLSKCIWTFICTVRQLIFGSVVLLGVPLFYSSWKLTQCAQQQHQNWTYHKNQKNPTWHRTISVIEEQGEEVGCWLAIGAEEESKIRQLWKGTVKEVIQWGAVRKSLSKTKPALNHRSLFGLSLHKVEKEVTRWFFLSLFHPAPLVLKVFPSSGGVLNIQSNGKCTYSSQPPVNPRRAGGAAASPPGVYTMSHAEKVACEVTDPDGNHFQVTWHVMLF